MSFVSEETKQLVKDIISIPSISSACFDEHSITVQFSQKDFDNDCARKYVRNYVETSSGYKSCGIPMELKDGVSNWIPSPSGKLYALIRKVEKAVFLDVWDVCQNKLLSSVTSSLFTKIYCDPGTVCGFEWNEMENKIAFIAEPKVATPVTNTSTIPDTNKKDANPTYDYVEDWGELLLAIQPTLFIFNISERKINQVSLPYSITSCLWLPNNKGFLVTGLDEPKLGLVFYNSRQAQLYYIPMAGINDNNLNWVRLTSDYSVRCARLNGSDLWFLTTDKVYLHNSCEKLVMIANVVDAIDTIAKDKILTGKTVVDYVYAPLPNSFPGFFGCSVTSCPFTSDSRLIISCPWRSSFGLISVDINSGQVLPIIFDKLSNAGVGCSITLLILKLCKGLAVVSSPTEPDRLVYFELSASNFLEFQINWKFVTSNAAYNFSQLKVDVLQVKSLSTEETNLSKKLESIKIGNYDFSSSNLSQLYFASADAKEEPSEIILIRSNNFIEDELPIILFPHGGPHSGFRTNWTGFGAIFAMLGYAIAFVNFRGSTGYGQDILAELPGHIGLKDVHDCISSLLQARLVLNSKEHSKVILSGGSHGGFLVGHLIGQFPGLFSCALMRNPVLNLVVQAGITDIPDWVFCELGLPYSADTIPMLQDYEVMFNASPIRYVESVVTPTLIGIGTADKRVPMPQSVEYFKILKRRGIKSRLLAYPDATHGLADKPSIEFDFCIQSIDWIISNSML